MSPKAKKSAVTASREKAAAKKSEAAVDSEKYLAAVSYIWILCFVPLFLKRKSEFVQHHAKQGLMLFIAEIVGPIVFWIPVVGWLAGLCIIVLAVMGIMKSLSGEEWEMPFLGKYAKKINL